jgi:hypothetical protein
MENNKLIAEALLEIAKNSETTFIEIADDKELINAAKKVGIVLPSPDLAVLKTVYAEIDKVNRNGVVLPKSAVEKGLPTLIGKQINWEHEGSGRICGYIIDAKINNDLIEVIGVIFKSLFPEEMEQVKEKFVKKDLCVSFEIWNKNPENGESVVHDLENGFRSINPITFHGCGLLLVHPPACPKAKIYKLVAKVLKETEKIVDKVFGEDLIFASMAIEEPKDKEESKLEEKQVEESVNGKPRTDEERAKNHFNISDEDWDKLSKEEKQEYIDKLPPRGTGRDEEEKSSEKMQAEETKIEEVAEVKEEQSSIETQTETKTEETKTEEKSEVAETKSEEVKVEETKEEPVIEAEVIVEEKKEEVIEEVVTVTYTEAQFEEKILSIKAEKDAEIALLKAEYEKVLSEKDKEIAKTQEELDKKNQEIATLTTEKAAQTTKDEQPSLTVGEVTAPGEDVVLKKEKKAINDFIASKHKK